MKIEISKPELFAAATHFISTDATRDYLNGVAVQKHPKRGLFYVATDGHCMFVGYDEDGSMLEAPDSVILQTPTMKPLTTKKYFEYAQLDINDETMFFNHARRTEKMVTTKIDGSFPDWRLVLPVVKKEPELAQYNAVYLGKFGKVSKLLGGSESPYVHQSGNGPAPIIFNRDDCYGVLMPIRGSAPDCLTCPGIDVDKPVPVKKAA